VRLVAGNLLNDAVEDNVEGGTVTARRRPPLRKSRLSAISTAPSTPDSTRRHHLHLRLRAGPEAV